MIHIAVAHLSQQLGCDCTHRQVFAAITGASTEEQSRRHMVANAEVVRLVVNGWSLDWISVNPITAEDLLTDKDVLSQVAIALANNREREAKP